MYKFSILLFPIGSLAILDKSMISQARGELSEHHIRINQEQFAKLMAVDVPRSTTDSTNTLQAFGPFKYVFEAHITDYKYDVNTDMILDYGKCEVKRVSEMSVGELCDKYSKDFTRTMAVTMDTTRDPNLIIVFVYIHKKNVYTYHSIITMLKA